MKAKKIRKIFMFLCIVIAMVSITSCEKETEDLIVGTWTIDSYSADILINEVSIDDYLTITLGLSQEQAALMKATYMSFFEMKGTVEFKSGGSMITELEDSDPETGTWELSSDGKKLITDAGTEDEMTMDIKSISKKELEISWSESDDSMDFNEDGTNENVEAEVSLKLKK